MSEVLEDANEFDKIVRVKPYRKKFLESFEQGWYLWKNFSIFQLRKKFELWKELISESIFLEIEQKHIDSIGLCFGFLIGVLRNPEYALNIADEFVRLMQVLKSNVNYEPFYQATKKIFLTHCYRKLEEEVSKPHYMPRDKEKLERMMGVLE